MEDQTPLSEQEMAALNTTLSLCLRQMERW